MTELGNIFDKIAEEQVIYHKIKAKTMIEDSIRANMLFNYYLYYAIREMSGVNNAHIEVRLCLKNFIIKETNLAPKVATINNTYQMAVMLDNYFLVRTLMGQQSNLILLNNDAAKLGALMALDFKMTGISKSDLLNETLLLA